MAPATRRAGYESFYCDDPAAPELAKPAQLTRADFERRVPEGLPK